ncbi:FAD-dependent oxidoreductase [Bradyrhizobium sp. 61]|uniref:FAD-dependent oxidoreductase n=1 Tax=unclassified Bradyrhizobium TaxID=2631580 RepID=UPI0021126A2A|nr:MULTISPECIES: FAD-dependent oxidoreductase [unclassified Bradyrhizobium]MCK1281580.1 FAD-dependent oxidoreductase [Bradyrhizobium sp. 61]MCK1447892.1 FAD-dependent oxidoreductase [Bradyrhizobium sp. 48]MCK1463584.1 FAD-dependent oxidoreductase [Bradyrhizobium sp. 2]
MPTKVIVLGGGVAGMSAAHELVERGFDVVVLESGDIAGGKARSIPVFHEGEDTSGHQVADGAGSSIQHRVPGEHGFRFFPGFYKHVIETMRRIPSFDGSKVADHLVPTTRLEFTQYDEPPFVVPAGFPLAPRDAGTMLRDILLLFEHSTGLTPDDLAFFGARVWQILTSCHQRRLAEYERTSWWEFVGAEQRSASYQKFLATGITRSLVASKARKASARTIGDIFVQLVLTILNPIAGSTDRVLDGPTNLVWIDPWLAYLESRGVRYVKNVRVEEILYENGRITGVVARQQGQRIMVHGDHYVAALPLEDIVPLVSDRLAAADPTLANLRALAPNLEWMNGVQFYLHRAVPSAHGHVIHIDTEWALTSISQLQFWRDVPSELFRDSDVHGILSVDLSDWTAPGSDGRPAMRCSREEVVRETWNQLKRSVNDAGDEVLRDEDLHSWFLSANIENDPVRPGWLRNSEPLLVNHVETWALRPEATTAIPNLFLASDYVRTHTDLATMEAANEAARRAVNGLLDAVKFDGSRCELWPLHEPEILLPWRLHDAARYQAGLPWDASLAQVAAHALRGASPLLEQASSLLEQVSPFTHAVADTLDPHSAAADDVGALDTVDPATMARRLVDVPTLQDALIKVADTVPLAGEIVGPAGFLDRLVWYRDMLADMLTEGVPTWEPQRHLYGLVTDFMGRSGKGLRPALCIATARALGGRAEDAFPAAAGLEMLHNAFLVHDDIEDGSDWRRGVATMHRRAGIPIAVNTGDSMNALAMRLFRKTGERLGPVTALRIFDEVDHMVVETLEGQANELGWVRDNDLTVTTDDYLRLVLKKTAWYSFIHPMRIGALVANGEDQNLGRFDRFGYLLGLAFQITDDVLNLVGDIGRYGKEIDGDLWEGKRTLLLAHALGRANPTDRAWISTFLARPRERRLPREVLRLHQIIADGGSIPWAQRAAAEFAEAAAREFHNSAFAGVPAGPDLEWLRTCINFLTQRDA